MVRITTHSVISAFVVPFMHDEVEDSNYWLAIQTGGEAGFVVAEISLGDVPGEWLGNEVEIH
jgi:hypothetical protein